MNHAGGLWLVLFDDLVEMLLDWLERPVLSYLFLFLLGACAVSLTYKLFALPKELLPELLATTPVRSQSLTYHEVYYLIELVESNSGKLNI